MCLGASLSGLCHLISDKGQGQISHAHILVASFVVGGCLFSSNPDSPNNHTETVLIKSLLGQSLLHVPSKLLHIKFTHFYDFIFYQEAHAYCRVPADNSFLSPLVAT